MARTSPKIMLEELSGEKFDSLDSACKASRFAIVFDLAQTIRQMLECGLLEIKDKKIQPKG
ncbi:MAG: hypothetical protein IT310_08530 [Anaerolineales bacterium]|nr:hypothetical protein [Anaerolineales bacterium]